MKGYLIIADCPLRPLLKTVVTMHV